MAVTPIGIIGTGNIFAAYLRTLKASRKVRIVGIADANPKVARERAREHGLQALEIDALLAGEASIILNLTPPRAHAQIGERVLAAGKHFHTEKPLAASYAEGKRLMALAQRKGLRIGAAPDTFLGQGAQTVRTLIDEGNVGAIHNGSAQFMGHGPDHWHPNPAFFYEPGAGPLMDMGPYYITHLVSFLGPVASVDASARTTFKERVVPFGPHQGKALKVQTPTHVHSRLVFAGGTEVMLTTSFDVWKHAHTPIELYGEKGSILVPDPNKFSGRVRYSAYNGDWRTVDYAKPYRGNCRGIGLIDLAAAIDEGREPRCGGSLALHVLEVMDKSLESARLGKPLSLETSCERPAALLTRLY